MFKSLREAAKELGISKSSLHRKLPKAFEDMTEEDWENLEVGRKRKVSKVSTTLQELEEEVEQLKKKVIEEAKKVRLLAEKKELLFYIDIGKLEENASQEQIDSLLKKAEELGL